MMPVSHRATGAYNTAIPAVPGGGFQAGATPASTPGGNGNANATNANVSGANAASNTSGTAGVGATNATTNSVTNPLQSSSSDSHNGVELNTLRSVTATTTSSSNNNNQSSSARSNMTYSRLNSSSTHGDADGDEERGSGAVV